MSDRISEMQALIDRRDEVIAKFKAVEKEFSREIKRKMVEPELIYKVDRDISPMQNRELS